jgi:hypothetical protein
MDDRSYTRDKRGFIGFFSVWDGRTDGLALAGRRVLGLLVCLFFGSRSLVGR